MLRPPEFFKTALRAEYVQVVHARAGVGFQSLIAIPVDKMHLGDAGCARALQPGVAAFPPVPDPVETHLTGPAHSAIHEHKIEARVASY